MPTENFVEFLVKEYPSIFILILGILVIILDKVKSIKAMKFEAEMDYTHQDNKLYKIGLALIIMGIVLSIFSYATNNYPTYITLNGEIKYEDGTPARFAHIKVGEEIIETNDLGQFSFSNVSRNICSISYKFSNLDFISQSITISYLDIWSKWIPIIIKNPIYIIKGSIKNEYNQPLPNAVVSVGNATTNTEIDGSYTINNVSYNVKTNLFDKIRVSYKNKLRYEKILRISPIEYKEEILIRDINLSSLANIKVSGIVSNLDDEPIMDAYVEIDNKSSITDNNGKFGFPIVSRNVTHWKVTIDGYDEAGMLYCPLNEPPYLYDRYCLNDIRLNNY